MRGLKNFKKQNNMSNNNNQPPPWSEAPPWAKYRAQDKDGWWCFYKYEPCVSQYDWVYSDIIFSSENYILAKKGVQTPKWKTTLQKRPENE